MAAHIAPHRHIDRPAQESHSAGMRCQWFGGLIGMLASTAVCAQLTVLRVMPQEGSAPKYMDAMPSTGLCPDILAAIERSDKSLKFSIAAHAAPIRRMESELRAGRVDIMCAMIDTPWRHEIAYRIHTPTYMIHERLVGRRDESPVAYSLQDLAQSKDMVITQSGASYTTTLRNAGVQVAESSGGSAVAMHHVESKRARFFYANALTENYYLRAEGLGDKLQIMPGVFQSTPSYLWAGHHIDSATVQKLEKALLQLKRSGELDRIYQHYESE